VARNGALRSIAWLFLFGSIFALPLGVYVLSPMSLYEISSKGWLSIVFMILIPTIGAYYLNAWALARAEPSTVAVYIYLQPLFGFTMAVMFLGEHFTLRSVLAGLIIFLGVFLVSRRRPEGVKG
jgi:drug/metabolite transporter (DMT)-like permease